MRARRSEAEKPGPCGPRWRRVAQGSFAVPNCTPLSARPQTERANAESPRVFRGPQEAAPRSRPLAGWDRFPKGGSSGSGGGAGGGARAVVGARPTLSAAGRRRPTFGWRSPSGVQVRVSQTLPSGHKLPAGPGSQPSPAAPKASPPDGPGGGSPTSPATQPESGWESPAELPSIPTPSRRR